jgi:putative transposase
MLGTGTGARSGRRTRYLVNEEINRRTDVVCVFPNPEALLRLAGSVLIEQHNEGEVGDRRGSVEEFILELRTMNTAVDPLEGVNTLPEIQRRLS